MTGMGKTFIYDRMKDGTFPKQIEWGSRLVLNNRLIVENYPDLFEGLEKST